MRNKYLVGIGMLIFSSLLAMSQTSLAADTAGTLQDAWNAITKLQNDLKNIQFTSGLPSPKTIQMMNSQIIISVNGSSDATFTTRWFDVSGGYNRIAIDVKKIGTDSTKIKQVSIDFTNDSSQSTGTQQATFACTTTCPLTTLPSLAKYYRIRGLVNSNIKITALGYLSTEGLPGPKGAKGDSGNVANSEIQKLNDQIKSLVSRVTNLETKINNPTPPPSGGKPSLTVFKNSAYEPANLVKGGSGLKIGSFNLQVGSSENIALTKLGLVGCTNNASSSDLVCSSSAIPNGISNISIKISDSLFGQKISSLPAGVQQIFNDNITLLASSTVNIDVFADVSIGFNPNANGNDLLGVQLAVLNSDSQTTHVNVSSSPVLGQKINMIGNGYLKLEADKNSSPIQQIVRSSQTGIPLMNFKVSEFGNVEDIKVNTIYIVANNASANFTNLALWDGSIQLGPNSVVRNAGSSTDHGEIRFSNLNLNITKGSSPKVLTLKGDSYTSGIQKVGQKSVFAPGYYEYKGVSSGNTVKVSGGAIKNSTTNDNADSSVNIVVTDGSRFKLGDRVAIDINADGDLDDIAETNSNMGFLISAISVDNLRLTAADTANADRVDTAIGGKVVAFDNGSTDASIGSRLNFSSQAMINHNSEPVVTVDSSASTGSNGSSNQPIATFNISASGTRDIVISALQFKFTGSFVSAGAGQASCNGTGFADGGIFAVQVWQNGQNQAGTLYRATTAGGATTCFGSGETASFLFTNPVTISVGSSTPTQFVIKANTSLVRAGLSGSGTISYGIYLDGVAGKGQVTGSKTVDTAQTLGGVFWDYRDVNGIYGATGTTTPSAAPIFTTANAAAGEVMDVTDYYPVNGSVINY